MLMILSVICTRHSFTCVTSTPQGKHFKNEAIQAQKTSVTHPRWSSEAGMG